MNASQAVERAILDGTTKIMAPENKDTRRFELHANTKTRDDFNTLIDPIRFAGLTKDGEVAMDERIRYRFGSFDVRVSEDVPANTIVLIQPPTETSPERRVRIINVGTTEVCVDPA